MEHVFETFQEDIAKVILFLRDEMGGIRSNRPTTKLVEDISVNYYGQHMPLKQLGSISIMPPRTIQVTLWDSNAVAPSAKAIEGSSLNVKAQVEGNTIHINLPALSEERRQELIKVAKAIGERSRISLRALRDDANKKIKKAADDKEMSEDDKYIHLEKIQKNIDDGNKNIEDILETKIAELKD